MKSVLNELVHINSNLALEVLGYVVEFGTDIQIKIFGVNKIISTKLKRIGVKKKHLYVIPKKDLFENKSQITIKIIINDKLFFLKTDVKKHEGYYCFDSCEHLYELVRRKKPRFSIPMQWSQSAVIQSSASAHELKTAANIIEMSTAGMKLRINAELPRYEMNQIINLKFKIFRRADIQLKAKIIHLRKNISTGPTVGLQFIDDSVLIKNKIQNICDDLAFFHTASTRA